MKQQNICNLKIMYCNKIKRRIYSNEREVTNRHIYGYINKMSSSSKQKSKSSTLQLQYYQKTLPFFLRQSLSLPNQLSINTSNPTQNSGNNLGQLELNLFTICRKGLNRQKFVEIFIKQLQEHIVKILNELAKNKNKNMGISQLIKEYCRCQLYLWKLLDQATERRIRNKQVITNEEKEKQAEHIRKFVSYYQELKKMLQGQSDGSAEQFIADLFKQMALTDKIPITFIQKMRKVLRKCKFLTIEKYISILSKQTLGKSTPQGYSTPTPKSFYQHCIKQSNKKIPQTGMKNVQQSDYKNEEQMQLSLSIGQQSEHPESAGMLSKASDYSQRSLPLHRKIFKTRNLGRTLFIGHPLHHRTQRNNQKYYVQYVFDKQEKKQPK